jgi:hypothetical protein
MGKQFETNLTLRNDDAKRQPITGLNIMSSFKYLCLLFLSAGAMAAATGTSSGGGGEGIAAQYSAVAKSAVGAVTLICKGADSTDPSFKKACSFLLPLEFAVNNMKVEPRSRNTVLGPDGQPRDAGNDGQQTVFLDVDRWQDKQSEQDPNKVLDVRTKQVELALHEPLVLAGAETNDQYTISDEFVALLSQNNFSFDSLVGKASEPVSGGDKPVPYTEQSTISVLNDTGISVACVTAKQSAEDLAMSKCRGSSSYCALASDPAILSDTTSQVYDPSTGSTQVTETCAAQATVVGHEVAPAPAPIPSPTPTLLYKIFQGMAHNADYDDYTYAAAIAAVEQNAQKEGYANCVITRTWFQHLNLNKMTADMYAEANCSKPGK